MQRHCFKIWILGMVKEWIVWGESKRETYQECLREEEEEGGKVRKRMMKGKQWWREEKGIYIHTRTTLSEN